MSLRLARPRKTIDDYLALGADVRAELMGGELYVTPSPTSDHQRAVRALLHVLAAFARSEGVGEAFCAPLDVHLPSGDVVQPDVLYVRDADAVHTDGIHGVPYLVVEVVSPDRPERDRAVKRALYERNAVPLYWIADPDERSLEGLAHDGSALRPDFYAVGDERVRPPSLPALLLDLTTIFPPRSA
jgi:Uma2 family endonuclease